MGAPDLKGLIPFLLFVFGVLGWAVIELIIWLSSNISFIWGE